MKLSESGAIIFGKTLVVADLHIGILGFPDYSLLGKVIQVYEKSKAERLVINGDIKHNLGKYELNSVKKFLLELNDRVSELVVVKGNHDGLLSQVFDVSDSLAEGDVRIFHGHKRVEGIEEAKRIIVAHTHPAVFIQDRVSGIKKRAWLVSRQKGRECIIMPAFNELCSSTAVNLEKPSGFIFNQFKEFDVFTVDGFYYGKVKF